MKLITITGPSGAGKDTVAWMLSERTGYKVLCSYTTRPKRDGEIDGVDHHFVEKCDVSHDRILTYTQYGGYEYWTTIDQVTAIQDLCIGIRRNPDSQRGFAGTYVA